MKFLRIRRDATGAAVAAAFALSLSSALASNLSYQVDNDWGSGFQAAARISNSGPAIGSWSLEFDYPYAITQIWDGRILSHSGSHYVVVGAGWNSALAASGEVSFGFLAGPGNASAAPTNCRLNGQGCTVNGGGTTPPPPDTSPPSVPVGLGTTAVGETTVDLIWSASSDDAAVAGYEVYRGNTRVGSTTAPAYADSGLAPATTYSYKISAVDAAGNISATSSPLTVTTWSPPPPPPASGGLSATFVKTSDWGSGYIGNFTVRNGGSQAVDGWKLEFDLPAGASITASWSGTYAKSGNHYALVNAAWNGRLAPGATATVGFQGDRGGSWNDPGNCTVNGSPCGGVPPLLQDTTPPGAPASLATTASTASTISLSWSAASDNVGVVAYDVYRGGVSVGTSTATGYLDTGLAASTNYAYTVMARDGAGNVSAASNEVSATTKASAPPPIGATDFSFAPYVDMTLYPVFDLAGAARDGGLRSVSLAFIVSGGGCKAAWGGVIPLDQDAEIVDRIEAFRNAGGDVVVSFGGAAGSELAQVCSAVGDLQAQYQAVIDRYNLTRIDFDVEGGAVADRASVDRRNRAITGLQATAAAAGRMLDVSYTLPVLPSGLTGDGLGVIASAIGNGARVDLVNVMAMDYGDWAAPAPAGRMGDYAIDSGTSTHDQLHALYPAKTDTQLWRMVGITPMIGVNDASNEIFTVADAQQVANFATNRNIGMLGMWSVNRDRQCSGGVQPYASPVCSSVLQQPWEFSRAFGTFAR